MEVQVAEHTRRKLNGRVVRIRADPVVSHAEPTPPAPPEQRCQRLLPAEMQAVSEAFKPLARIEREQRDVDDQQRDARITRKLQQLPGLQSRAEKLKNDYAQARGHARMTTLSAIEAAAVRAGAVYRSACRGLGDAAAELEALARLRDELVVQNTFDPLGIWQRVALVAPPVCYRGRGWAVSLDVWQRDCYWAADSAAHHDAVRRVKTAMRAELDPALDGARWPFE